MKMMIPIHTHNCHSDTWTMTSAVSHAEELSNSKGRSENLSDQRHYSSFQTVYRPRDAYSSVLGHLLWQNSHLLVWVQYLAIPPVSPLPIVLYLYIYIVLLVVHTNQKCFQCKRPREKRAILRERKEALGAPVSKVDRVEGRSWFA